MTVIGSVGGCVVRKVDSGGGGVAWQSYVWNVGWVGAVVVLLGWCVSVLLGWINVTVLPEVDSWLQCCEEGSLC